MKSCIKCNIPKPLDEYYKHPNTADGYFNKCKECCIKYQAEKVLTPDQMEAERKRHREKYTRLGYKEKQKEWDKDKLWKSTSAYRNLRRDLKIPKGHQGHHWSYNDEHLRDVIILTIKQHREAHKDLVFDPTTKMFKNKRGDLLDTKEKHILQLTTSGIYL